jgi:hypothetical protein
MAETPSASGASKVSDEAQETMKKQIAELRREITRINRTLSDRAEEVAEAAHGWYDSAADTASRATRQMRSQAQAVSDTVQENPGTISTALVLGGLLGVLLGIAIARSSESDHRWF